jgi:hypothetical protein
MPLPICVVMPLLAHALRPDTSRITQYVRRPEAIMIVKTLPLLAMLIVVPPTRIRGGSLGAHEAG